VLTGAEDPEAVIVTADDGVELPVNVHLIPARRNLEKVDKTLLVESKFLITQDVLIAPLQRLEHDYDYIFLDTAPNATIPTIAAYKAARWFILAAMPEPLAIAGLNDALTDIQSAQQSGNPHLRLLGVVLSGVEGRRTRLATALIDTIEEQFATGSAGSAKFETTITRSTVVPEAQRDGRTLFQSAPLHKLCDQYRALATEVETRIGRSGQEDRSPDPARRSRQEALVHG
jgi:chromosome partitioning protein